MKTIDKIPAQILRRRGHSLDDLSRRFDISKSTASLWTKDIVLTKLGLDRVEQKRRSSMLKGHEILHIRKLKRLERADKEADRLLESIGYDKQTELVALAMMYWCEGLKSDRSVGFTNSDPKLARAFLVMFEDIFKIDKKRLRVCVHLHDYHNEKEILAFWAHSLRIPLVQFTKPFRKKSEHAYQKKDYKGCVHIKYCDAHVARVLLAFAKKFINHYI